MPTLSFQETGEGHPILLLHGFCETHEIWKEFVPPLAAKFRIIMPDLPGFGESETLPGSFTIDQVANRVAEWITEQKIPPSVIIGHSLGGYVALALADRYPQLVKGFGLFHSTAFADSQEKMENRNKVIDFVSRHGVAPFLSTFVPALFFDKSHPDIQTTLKISSRTNEMALIRYTSAMRDRMDRSFILSKSEIPKLLIAGVEDVSVPIHVSREMAKISQKSSYFELRGVAHMGFFEAKTECEDIITRFTESIFFNN